MANHPPAREYRPAMATSSEPPPESARHPPWGWIGLCVLLAVVAAGLAIWALGLQGDLDDEREQSAQAQQQLDEANDDVSSLSEQVDELRQSVSDVSDQIGQAGADVQQNAQQALDDLRNNIASLEERARDAIEQIGGGP
jgi:peptidoglycan hydrolase CwlO-like protein